MKKRLSYAIVLFGQCLVVLGVVTLSYAFFTFIVSGNWPDFLMPIQAWCASSETSLGSLSFPMLMGVFIAPGILIQWIGNKIDPGTNAWNRRKF